MILMKILFLGFYTSTIRGSLEPTCSVDGEDWPLDPALHEMRFDIGFGEEIFYAYKRPSIESFSQGKYLDAQTPLHNGFAVKFINMSPNYVDIHW